jgi:hypothetical protein
MQALSQPASGGVIVIPTLAVVSRQKRSSATWREPARWSAAWQEDQTALQQRIAPPCARPEVRA